MGYQRELPLPEEDELRPEDPWEPRPDGGEPLLRLPPPLLPPLPQPLPLLPPLLPPPLLPPRPLPGRW